MMLWLLATLSVVTMSWGIAHRLKAVNPAINCTREGCSVLPRRPHLTCEPLLAPKPKDDPPTLERALSVENPEPRHNTH